MPPDAQYAEYYARLAETASTWKRLKLELATNFPKRPMLIVHYGDHQPVVARRIDRQLELPTMRGARSALLCDGEFKYLS
jgi:hypothetical protein